MAKLSTMMNANIPDKDTLEKELAVMNRWGFLSGPQYVAAAKALEPMLPAVIKIDMRVRKGMAIVTVANTNGMTSFNLTNRAQIE